MNKGFASKTLAASFALMTALTVGVAHAASVVLTSKTVLEIQPVQANSAGLIFIKITNAGHKGAGWTGCTSYDYAAIPMGASYPASPQLLQIALAAQISGKTVDAVINSNCITDPTSSTGATYPELRSLIIR